MALKIIFSRAATVLAELLFFQRVQIHDFKSMPSSLGASCDAAHAFPCSCRYYIVGKRRSDCRTRERTQIGVAPFSALEKTRHSITTKTRRHQAHPRQWREHPCKGIRTGTRAGGAVVLTAFRNRRQNDASVTHASHNTRTANCAPSTPKKAFATHAAGAAAVARPPPSDARWSGRAPRTVQKNAVRKLVERFEGARH